MRRPGKYHCQSSKVSLTTCAVEHRLVETIKIQYVNFSHGTLDPRKKESKLFSCLFPKSMGQLFHAWEQHTTCYFLELGDFSTNACGFSKPRYRIDCFYITSDKNTRDSSLNQMFEIKFIFRS